jgi:hypothetical protein
MFEKWNCAVDAGPGFNKMDVPIILLNHFALWQSYDQFSSLSEQCWVRWM